jgi:hypothetical protein
LLVAALLVAVPARAGLRFETHVRITSVETEYTGNSYLRTLQGKVTSEKRNCLGKRRVKIQSRYKGRWVHLRQWSTTTDKHGLWEFGSGVNGIVRASKLRAKVLHKRLDHGLCSAALSKGVRPDKR